MSAGRFQKGLSIAVVALVVLAITATYLLPKSDQGGLPSVTSNRPDGRRALFLSLQRLGLAPEAWRKAPGALPHGEHVLWSFGVPFDTDKGSKSGSKSRAPSADTLSPAQHGLHSAEHYRSFVDAGGTLILRWNERTRAFLVDGLALEGVKLFDAPALGASGARGTLGARRIAIADGSEVSAAWHAGAVLPPTFCDSLARALWTSAEPGEEGHVLAATIDVGGGRIVLLADDAFTANEHLGEGAGGELAVRLIEEQGAVRRLFFDEYALGLWEPQTAVGLAFSGSRLSVTMHAIVALCVLAWMLGWTRAFPRDPPPLDAVSPLSRARALANVFVRGGRVRELSNFARRGEFERLRRKARLPRVREASTTGATAWTRAAVERELELASARLGTTSELPKWRAAWIEKRVESEAELGALFDELDGAVGGAVGGSAVGANRSATPSRRG